MERRFQHLRAYEWRVTAPGRPETSMLFGLVPKSRCPNAVEMAYITTRNNRFYVVTYDGVDPATGKERRRWHAAGRSRADAEAIANSPTTKTPGPAVAAGDGMTLVEYLTNNWLNERQHRVRPTTAARYRWIIDHYINPTVGSYRLRSIRTEHLDDLYANLSASGGRDGRALASKTVHEVHLIVASALRDAHRKGLVRDNVASCAPSSAAPRHTGCTRRCTSQRQPGCVAANSPDCTGETGTRPTIDSPSTAAAKPSTGAPPSSQPRHAPADDASTSTM